MAMKKTGTPVKASVLSKGSRPNGSSSAPTLALVEKEVAAEKDLTPPVLPAPPVAKAEPAEEDLDSHDAAVAQLAMERVTTAQLTLQARQKELEGVLLQVKNKYEVGGRFVLRSIDIPRGKIVRQAR